MRRNQDLPLVKHALSFFALAASCQIAFAGDEWVSRSTFIKPNNCGISVKVPANTFLGNGFNAEIPKKLKAVAHIESLAFNFECRSSNDEVVNSGWARFDPKGNTWGVNFFDDKDKKQRENFTKFSLLENKNSRGWLVTVSDFTGEEKFREKKLYFCLTHLEKAVCGWGSVGLLVDGKRGDLTSYVTKIVRSIEFID
ncbi:MAG: hypothetical protein J7605_05225 [Variovorax sp.]|nr:hypothetical protein [Variovorax sp.]